MKDLDLVHQEELCFLIQVFALLNHSTLKMIVAKRIKKNGLSIARKLVD